MDNSKGRYWDKPWGLVSSCTRCSEGCRNCWTLALEKRFHRGEEGKVVVHPEKLDIPLRTRKPTRFATWNDLFHEDVPDEFIDRAFAAMASSSQHIFLALTKRPQRMQHYMMRITKESEGAAERYESKMRAHFERYKIEFQEGYSLPAPPTPELRFIYDSASIQERRPTRPDGTTLCCGFSGGEYHWRSWPLHNVYLGVTVCNQAEADEKIPELLKVPGKRFLSIEPMLGEIDLRPFLGFWQWSKSENFQTWVPHEPSPIALVILGGETGPGARPMHPDWVRSVRDQCQASGVPYFFKQWGEWAPKAGDGKYAPQCFVFGDGLGDVPVFRVGSKVAGRLLDGREWNELPWRHTT